MTTAVVNSINKKGQKVKNVFRAILNQEVRMCLVCAGAYAAAGLNMEGRVLKVQALYVLSNLGYWQGDEARRCKKVLKEFTR